MKTIWGRLTKLYPALNPLLEFLKNFTLPGFDGIPLYDVYKFFIAEIKVNSLPIRSKAIAFSFFLAFFPALTFVFSLIPYVPYFRDMDIHIMNFMREVLPNRETYAFIQSFIEPLLKDLARHKRSGLLTGSIFLVLFLTSNGVMAMMNSFDKSYDHYKKRNAIQSRLVALQITFLLIVVFILSFGLIITGRDMLALLFDLLNVHNRFSLFLLNIVRYVFIGLMVFLSISLIYYFAPATKKKYKFISTGATVATILSILVSIGFSYWVNNFNRLNVIFGSIGTIMLLMIWLNVNAFVMLIGYEINVSIRYNRSLHQKELEIKDAEKKK
jgi:membrane protein